jgi:small conductance mechanosensitive channel
MFNRFQQSLNSLSDKLGTWLDSIVLALPNIVLAAVTLVIFLLLARRLKKVVKKVLLRTNSNQTVIGLLSNLSVAVFMLIALIVILNILNLSDAVTALLGTAGVAGLAVGLALQDPLVNLFSGVLMSVRDYYKVGDLVETNGYFGKIQKINLRSTILMTPDGQEVVIPNKDVIAEPLVNYSHTNRRRIDLTCGVAYGDDLEKVKKVVMEALENCGFDREEIQPVELFFTEFGDSSINFVLRYWQNISSQGDYLKAKDRAIIAIKKAFDANGITIPFPIRTLDFGVVGGVRLDEVYPQNSDSRG